MSDDDGEFTVVSQASQARATTMGGTEKELRQSFSDMLNGEGMDSFMESCGNFLSDEEFFEMSSMDVFKDMYEEYQKTPAEKKKESVSKLFESFSDLVSKTKKPSPKKTPTKPKNERLARMRKELRLEEIDEEESKASGRTSPSSVARPGQFNVSVSTFFTEGEDESDEEKIIQPESNSSRKSDSGNSLRSRRANALNESHSKMTYTPETPRPRGRRQNSSANASSTDNGLSSSTTQSSKILMKPLKESERSHSRGRSRSRSRGRTPTRERDLTESSTGKPSPTTPRRQNLSSEIKKGDVPSEALSPRRRIAASSGLAKSPTRKRSTVPGKKSTEAEPAANSPTSIDPVERSPLQKPRNIPISNIQAKRNQMGKERPSSVGRGRRVRPDEQRRRNRSRSTGRQRAPTNQQEGFKTKNTVSKSLVLKETIEARVPTVNPDAPDEADDDSVEEFTIEGSSDKQCKSSTSTESKEKSHSATLSKKSNNLSKGDKKKKYRRIKQTPEANKNLDASYSDEAAESVPVDSEDTIPSRSMNTDDVLPQVDQKTKENSSESSDQNVALQSKSADSRMPNPRYGRRHPTNRPESENLVSKSHHSAQNNTSAAVSSTSKSKIDECHTFTERTKEPKSGSNRAGGRSEVRERALGAGNQNKRCVSVGRVGTTSRSLSKSPLRGGTEEDSGTRESLRNSTSEHVRHKTPTRTRHELPQPRHISRSEELRTLRTKPAIPALPQK
jgi:hypothetical protein